MAISKLKVKATSTNNVSSPNSLKVTKKEEPDMQKIKADWNKYLDYLEKKGVKGKPELDKGGLGNQYFNEYIKANPNTSLSVSVIPKIRQAYIELRNTNIEEIKKGKAGFNGKSGPDTDFSGFMKHIVDNENSQDPNYVGQHLTRTPFPAMLDYQGKVAVPLYTTKQAKQGVVSTVDAAIEAKKKTTKQ